MEYGLCLVDREANAGTLWGNDPNCDAQGRGDLVTVLAEFDTMNGVGDENEARSS